jgi:hypothetical protein
MNNSNIKEANTQDGDKSKVKGKISSLFVQKTIAGE